MNKPNPHNHNLDWVQISRDSAKLVTFIDLAGHEKYLKTTIFGMTGHMPDYTMLMVHILFFLTLWVQIGANMGVIGTTKEHLSLALSLTVPVYIVVGVFSFTVYIYSLGDKDWLVPASNSRGNYEEHRPSCQKCPKDSSHGSNNGRRYSCCYSLPQQSVCPCHIFIYFFQCLPHLPSIQCPRYQSWSP